MKNTRGWRFGIWFANELVPYKGEISWEDKRIRFTNPMHNFSEKGIYDTVFVDPTYGYSLVKAHLRPLKIVRDPDNKKSIIEVVFEFYHRKD